MQIGDLVKGLSLLPLGMIVGFDEDDDPIVRWLCSSPYEEAYYRKDIEIISSCGDRS
jgi:hypothetical protein